MTFLPEGLPTCNGNEFGVCIPELIKPKIPEYVPESQEPIVKTAQIQPEQTSALVIILLGIFINYTFFGKK